MYSYFCSRATMFSYCIRFCFDTRCEEILHTVQFVLMGNFTDSGGANQKVYESKRTSLKHFPMTKPPNIPKKTA